MRTFKIILTGLLFIGLTSIVFGQSYSFEVEKVGEGKQAIIFIPGLASSGNVWEETVANFKENFSCYTLTMPGFAGVKPEDDPSFEKWEKAVADYIRENEMDQSILVGHSMGGALAMAIAADYPDLISKIVVVDALPFLAALQDPNAKSEAYKDCSVAVDALLEMPDEQFYQQQKTAISYLVNTTAMQDTVINWSLQSDRRTFAKMYCDFSNTDLREKITGIKVPARVLLESYFVNFKPAIEEQYKNLKTAQLEYAEKGLHFIMFDDKEWYFEQLNNFIPAE